MHQHDYYLVAVLVSILLVSLGVRSWLTSKVEIDLRTALQDDIIKRGQLEEKLQSELLVSTELAEISKALISPIDSVANIASQVLESGLRLTDSSHGFVSEVNELTRDNVIQSVTRITESGRVVSSPEKGLVFSPDENGKYDGLWGETLNTGQPFIANDAQNHSKSKGVPQGHVSVEKFLSVPVKYDNVIIGQICLANPKGLYFDRHVDCVQRLAELYSIAIHRDRVNKEKEKLSHHALKSSQLATLGELSAGVAHEINNPINGVINYAQIVLNRCKDDVFVSDLCRRIIKEGDRIAYIVKKLLNFSRKEEGIYNEHNIESLIENTIALVEKKLENDGIKIELEIDHDVFVKCNEQELEQVFLNLIINSQHALNKKYRHTNELKKITVKSRLLNDLLIVEFTDFGVGIKDDQFDKIFNTFYTTKDLGAGTGLGLSICEDIIKRHKGEIKVESEFGEYTKVKLILPALPVRYVDSNALI